MNSEKCRYSDNGHHSPRGTNNGIRPGDASQCRHLENGDKIIIKQSKTQTK